MCVPWELNPQPFALLTQCSTTEPQEHIYHIYDLSHISRFINLSHFLGSLRIGYGALSLQRGQHDRIPDPKHREQPGVLHH